MLQPLDGPSAQATLSVGTVTVVEVKAGGTALEERKVITIQPIGGKIYVYFGDGVTTPSAATVAADGFEHTNKLKESYEAASSQQMFILSAVGTINVKIAERA